MDMLNTFPLKREGVDNARSVPEVRLLEDIVNAVPVLTPSKEKFVLKLECGSDKFAVGADI